MELGQNQKLWVDALRSGKYPQCRRELCHIDEHGNSYCCLGVASELFNFEPETNETLDGCNYDAILGLYDSCGEIESEDDLMPNSLAGMNDDGKSFIEIADFIEANPQLVFTHSV